MRQDTITSRQLCGLFIFSAVIAISSPMFFEVASSFGKSGWILPLFVVAIAVSLMALVGYLLKKGSLEQLISDIFGKFLSKIIFLAVFVWAVSGLLSSIRAVADRFSETLFPDVNITFFLFPIAAVTCIISRGKLTSFARLGVLFGISLSVAFLICVAMAFARFDAGNLLLPATDEILPMFFEAPKILVVFQYLILFLFLSGRVSDREKFTKAGVVTVITVSLLSTFFLAFIYGLLGVDFAKTLSSPFFGALKTLNISTILQRPEIFMVTIWALPDLLAIVIIAKSAAYLLGRVIDIENGNVFVTPLHFLAVMGCLVFGAGLRSPGILTNDAALYCDLAFIAGLPLLTFIVGKIRRKI